MLKDAQIGNEWLLIKDYNWGDGDWTECRAWTEPRMNCFWIIPRGSRVYHLKCFVCGKEKEASSLSSALVSFERYVIRTPICDDCLDANKENEARAKVRELYNAGPEERSP